VAGLAAVGWPGPAHDPATLIGRVSVLAMAAMLAGLPALIRRHYGPPAAGWAPTLVRAAGLALMVALLAVKSMVEQVEFGAPGRRPSPGGLWTGELIFLAVIAAYLAGLLIATASRGPVTRSTLVIGSCSGAGIGVLVYALRPLADQLHPGNGALAVCYELAKVLAVPVVLAAAVAAAMAAARRAPNSRKNGLAARDMRARQGFAAGTCVGLVAALVVSLLGIVTIAVAPHLATGLQWTLPFRSAPPGSVYDFEVAITEAGAGYLLVLLIFPLLGAGLGAWAGLFAGDGGLRPDGGGGGGGPGRPGPKPPPGGGGLHAPPPPALPRADLAALLTGADWRVIAPDPARERVPAGAPGGRG
jgi:hypothetical protein